MKHFQQLKFILLLCATLLTGITHAQIQVGGDIDGEAAGDFSGRSVAISADGSRIAIGATGNDGNGFNSGHVRVYEWIGGIWTQMGSDIEGDTTGDESGASVSLSSDGTRVAIGAWASDDPGNQAGHVKVYDWNGSSWVQVGADIDGEAAGDQSGRAVSLSSDGSRIAVGAPVNDGNGDASGHVRIFEWNGSAWLQLGSDIDGEAAGDQSGVGLSLSSNGTRVAIGAFFNSGNGNVSGHVRIFDWSGSAWVQVGADIDGEAEGDLSGRAVSLSADGNRVAVGATENDGNGTSSGHTRIFHWDGSAWVQVGNDIDGEAAEDFSGTFSSLSADGDRVAIGADGNDANGSFAGHVRIFDWNGSAWIQAGSDIDGEASFEFSGEAGHLSSNGARVIISAPGSDSNGINSGIVRVFEKCTEFSPDGDNDGICDAEDSCPSFPGEIGDPCDDGIACTENDVIDASCECHGTPNDNICDDGNLCNGAETCDIDLGCLAGTPLVCDDGNSCTTDSCDPLTGCVFTVNNDACDDGNACTITQCSGGACIVVGTVDCDDGDPCTIDTCDPVLGCQYENICEPANNDCANAQPLSVPTFPTTSNETGTLYGATNDGGTACTGSADGGDVFYTFTIANENHVGITVNPFAGADVVVEVLDGCAGTSIACINNEGAGSSESELLENLDAGIYTIRVHNASGLPEPEGSASFLINVQQMPYAQVQDNPNSTLYACNQSDFQLEDFVGASPQTTSWVLDYEWLAAEEGGGAQTVYQRTEPNYVARISWLGMEYGKTYNVFVRVLIDHPQFGPTWGVYPGDYQNPNLPGASACTISTATNVTPTELRPNYTPTNAAGNTYALCDFAIAYNVSGSENFRWRFDGNGTPGDAEDIIYTRGTGNPSVRLSWVNNLTPGLNYNVAVEVQVAGQWSGYSTVLPVTLALPPNDVQLRALSCGATVAPNGYVLSESVCEADNYTFEFVPQGGGTTITYTSGNYVCFLNNLSPSVVPGTTYDTRVKVSQGGVPGDFGPICDVTVSGPVAPGSGMVSQRDIAANESATLFPNPNAGDEVLVNLEGLSAGNHEVMITVYDIYGKQISSEGFGHEGTSFSRLVRFDGNMATGIYMVQITVDGDRFATERMIVK